MRFIADGMLGKLTRWLRMLGQDIIYSNNAEDSQLLSLAKKETRTLLTRDFELYQRAIGRKIDASYLQGATEGEVLAELSSRYGIKLEIDMSLSRCPRCNALIEPISREEAAVKVKKNTFEHYTEFWACSGCSQVYWHGAHWAKIVKTLAAAKEMVRETEKEG